MKNVVLVGQFGLWKRHLALIQFYLTKYRLNSSVHWSFISYETPRNDFPFFIFASHA